MFTSLHSYCFERKRILVSILGALHATETRRKPITDRDTQRTYNSLSMSQGNIFALHVLSAIAIASCLHILCLVDHDTLHMASGMEHVSHKNPFIWNSLIGIIHLVV